MSLEIFNVIKSSHAQHGLRHGDYVRYRQYCTRRLHRIRKSVNFIHGTGSKGRFSKRTLEPQMVRNGRHLMLPLYNAERAWSYAMAIKRENTAQEPRPRFHLLQRLNKAAKWGAALQALCAVRGDKRTALEAEAYSGFMSGNMHLEREQWGQALANLRRTRTICTELCRVSMADQVHLYKQVAEEVEPSIRFCAYNLRRLGEGGDEGDEEANDDVEGLLDESGEGGGSDILRSKLEAVLQESRARQAQNLNEIEVLGERVPIKSDKVRIAILASQQKVLEIQAMPKDADGGLMQKYDELFVAFNDALEGVRTDLRQAAKEQTARSGVTEASLVKLQASLIWQKLDHTVAHKMHLVEQFKRTMSGEAAPPAGSGGKRAAPEDLVRLYDSAISSLQEMAQLDGYREEAALMDQVNARLAAAKACRCYYLAASYGAANRYAEAQALYERAADLMSEGVHLLQGAGYAKDSTELESLANLEMLIDGAKARAHAQAFVNTLEGSPAVSDAQGSLGKMDLTGAAAMAAGRPLLDSADVFERSNPENLVAFPPDFVTVPCKPLLFDIARNQITPPDLSSRAKPRQQGSFMRAASSYLFGGSR